MLLTILRRYFIKKKVSLSLSLYLTCELLSIIICIFQHYRGQERLAHYIDIPGGEIPNWFCHRNVGASVSLQMPSGYCNELMRIAVCVVFVFRQHNPLDQLDFKDWGRHRFTHELSCSIESKKVQIDVVAHGFSEKFGKIERHHLWLQYFPSQFFKKDWKDVLSKSFANGFSDIEIKFKT